MNRRRKDAMRSFESSMRNGRALSANRTSSRNKRGLWGDLRAREMKFEIIDCDAVCPGVRVDESAKMLQLNHLYIVPGLEAEFERTFAIAAELLMLAEGYEAHSLRRCVESPAHYLLLVQWRRVEDHTVIFRVSPEHGTWKGLLDRFYVERPQSMHFERVSTFEAGVAPSADTSGKITSKG